MKKTGRLLSLAIGVFFLIYLSLPVAEIPPLPDSLKSTEPGDTVEIPGVSAYYTNTSRQEVVDFYKQAYSRSAWFNLALPVVVLDHPPEYTKQAIRDTTETTFLYELVHPFRDSLFINGFDPAESPKFKGADPTQVIAKEGQYWERKITLRVINSPLIIRVIIFFIGLGLLAKVLNEIKIILASLLRRKK